MSGVAGADRVKSRQDFQQFLKSYKDLISQFPGFVGFNPSGSYNSDMAKNDFGDIDIIVHIKSDKDKATVKKELQAFLQRQPETVIVPFSSAKHAGKRSYNAGELVSVRYHDDSLGYSAQIDNIVALDQTEATFKQLFLDWPAEKQGLILGLVKIATIETDPAVLFKKLGINAQPNIEQNQEYEFNLSSVELQLRLATYDPELLAQGQYKQLSRDVVWSTRNFEDIQKLLYQYDLDANFDQLLAKSKQVIKNPRSNARMQGVFGSMITVKSGEVGTAKGAGKEAALDKIKQTFGESRGLLRALIETSAPSTVVFAFGRLQPPTIGHELLVNAVKQTAEQNHCSYVIYVSRTVGKTPAEKLKNPLTVDQKMGYLSRMFPGTNFQPATDAVRTPVEAAKHLNQKYRNLIMIAGGSRAEEFEKLLNDYNGKDYNFDSIRVVKIERDPDADDAAGMSGTKMRQAAAADDFATFKSGVPGALDDASAQQLMADVKAGMTPTPKIKKIKEDTSPAMKRTAKDLENPPKVMQHRAKRDQEREQQYKNAQLRRDHEDDDIDEIFGLKTKPEAPKPKKLTPDDYAELMKMSKQQTPVGSTGNKKVYHNPDEFDWDKKHGLAEANSLEGTVKTITDHGKYIAQVFEQLKAMAKRYVDGRGDLKGFSMVAGGVGSRWFNDFYFNKLQAELYALTKQAPKYSQALIYFLKDASEDREHKISFNEISKQLPTILFNMGHKMKSGALTQFADNWGNRYHEYKNYLTKIEVEAGYDDDEFDEPKVKAPKSNAIGKQNTQVDQIINSVLAKLPKNVAGDVRNAIARSDNKLQALHQELQKRDIQGVAEGLNEFAPPGSDDGGDDGFSEETLKRLAAQWYNGDEDPGVERTLMAAGWEIGQDEGYDNGGVFVVQSGDEHGRSYLSWPAEELQQGVAEAATPSNKLFVKKLTSEQELIEHAKQFAKNLVQEGVPITSKNRYTVVCSTIFAQTRKSLTESKHIIGGKQVIELLKRLDQFSKLSFKVGSKVAIINSQLQGDSIELWGFTTPKTITKIYRDPSDKSIKQFEFNNDPDDVWPRTENAEYNGQFLMYSAFFDDKKSAEHALTMLTLQTSGDLIIRNHIAEKGVAEGPYTNKKESFDGGSYAANKKGFAGQGRYTDMTRNDQGYNIGENWELAKAEAIARLIESQLK